MYNGDVAQHNQNKLPPVLFKESVRDVMVKLKSVCVTFSEL